MQQQQAEKIVTEYQKSIYGFALKRCSNLQDAEDLSQEIALKAYRALLLKDSVESPEKFIWTVARHALANYYRGKAKTALGVPWEALAEFLPSEDDPALDCMAQETAERLHTEIAYLSKLQRRIVIAYYYENKKQEAIARECGIPLGTVKWHLFEAKQELKKGMKRVRQQGELKFNPIQFALCGTNGSPGMVGGRKKVISNFCRNGMASVMPFPRSSVHSAG